MPEPTVKVRMKENARAGPLTGVGTLVIALGDVSVTGKEITVTHTRYAFVKAGRAADIVSRSLRGRLPPIPVRRVDMFDVPGVFEPPRLACDVAGSVRFAPDATPAAMAAQG
jgi:6,7-dimethyl-8-ribityllumazine synthase